jgi:hypothetical protein
MPFPFSYSNKVEIPFSPDAHTPENLLNSIVLSLKNVKAINIHNDRNHITFSGGILRFVMNWNILVAVSSGKITVDKGNDKLCLKYSLKFTEMFIIVTAAVLGFLGPVIWQASNLTFSAKVGILAVAWSWLFGGNYFITIFRFPNFIKKMTEIK